MKHYLKFTFALLITICGCNNADRIDPEKRTISNSDVEKLDLFNLKGDLLDLKKYKGKILFINFWATWCKPCIAEMPTIKNAMDSLKNEKIDFLFASDEAAEEVQRFEAAYNFGFNYVKVVNLDELNIAVLPTTFIFDKVGRLVFSEMGYRKWDDTVNINLMRSIIKDK